MRCRDRKSQGSWKWIEIDENKSMAHLHFPLNPTVLQAFMMGGANVAVNELVLALQEAGADDATIALVLTYEFDRVRDGLNKII